MKNANFDDSFSSFTDRSDDYNIRPSGTSHRPNLNGHHIESPSPRQSPREGAGNFDIGRSWRRFTYRASNLAKATGEATHAASVKAQEATHLAQVQSHIASLKARMSMWDREIKDKKERFGIDCYDVMERNRNIDGEQSGGETEPTIVEIFTKMVEEMKTLQEQRKEKFTALTRMNRGLPLALMELESAKAINDDASSGFSGQWTLAQIKKDLSRIDAQVENRKKQFGIEMFDAMVSLGDDWLPTHPDVKVTYLHTRKVLSKTLKNRQLADTDIKDLELNGCVLVTYDEVEKYVLEHCATTFTVLSMTTLKPIDVCQQVCVNVAARLVRVNPSQTPATESPDTRSSFSSQISQDSSGSGIKTTALSRRKFTTFVEDYIQTPVGAQDFHNRCLFAAFDKNRDGYLVWNELLDFLDTFHKSGPIFPRRSQLSNKERFKEIVWNYLVEEKRRQMAEEGSEEDYTECSLDTEAMKGYHLMDEKEFKFNFADVRIVFSAPGHGNSNNGNDNLASAVVNRSRELVAKGAGIVAQGTDFLGRQLSGLARRNSNGNEDREIDIVPGTAGRRTNHNDVRMLLSESSRRLDYVNGVGKDGKKVMIAL